MISRWLGGSKGKDNAFEEWQKQNPSKPFKDFFAQAVTSKLASGRAHASLGGNLQSGTYGRTGHQMFKNLRKYGLKEDDNCVDYGCGTLRLGVHVINYLRRGAYWGLDISDFLLQEGRRLIGDSLWAEKHPNLRLISTESIAEVAALKPPMLFSVKVLIHIHPDELSEYFRNIMKIIPFSGQAIITGKWSGQETIQISKLGWAHGLTILEDVIKAQGGRIEIVREHECELKGGGQSAKSGIFRIVHERGTAQL